VARPFLKWAGGKQWLAPYAASIIPPTSSGTYYEPFLGGGAMFFASARSKAVLSDANSELLTTYSVVRNAVEALITKLGSFPYTRRFYEEIRRRQPRTDLNRACRMIYLNKTAWNGLYRVNLDGQFNVPFGDYVNPGICQVERLRAASMALRSAALRDCDFEDAVAEAGPGDAVYFDPPYITGHTNNGFLKYNAPLFSWDDQRRLAEVAKDLAEREVHVVVSNAAHAHVRRLYRGFHCYSLQRSSRIAADSRLRGSTREVILCSVPIAGVPTRQVP
jgi:DNA adenine methylase